MRFGKEINFDNGSSIKAIIPSEPAFCSNNTTWYIIEEAAHIEKLDDDIMFQMLVSGAGITMLSTPSGKDNLFYRCVTRDVSTTNNKPTDMSMFITSTFDFRAVPGRDEEWMEKMIKTLGKEAVFQELLCFFL